MAKCPESKYSDDKGICRDCNDNCKHGCSGPHNTVGPNACNDCYLRVMAGRQGTNISKCLPENSACEVGYHPDNLRFNSSQKGSQRSVSTLVYKDKTVLCFLRFMTSQQVYRCSRQCIAFPVCVCRCVGLAILCVRSVQGLVCTVTSAPTTRKTAGIALTIHLSHQLSYSVAALTNYHTYICALINYP